MYTKTYQTVNGCDSIRVLNLTVNPTSIDTTTISICEDTTYSFEGTNYTETGTYITTLQTITGCDSIKVLDLTVNPTYIDTTTISICNGEKYTFENEDYDKTGVYTKKYQTVNGCDSIRFLT